jgi:hypothetical protein
MHSMKGSISSIILRYSNRILCKQLHTRPYFYCRQHLSYNCKICAPKSKHCRYIYNCPLCLNTFCIKHYLQHSSLNMLGSALSPKINCCSNMFILTSKSISIFDNKKIKALANHIRFNELTFERNNILDGTSVEGIIERVIAASNSPCISSLGINLARYYWPDEGRN